MSRHRLAFFAWFLLACVAAASMGAYHYPPWVVVLLGGVWLVSSIIAAWASPRHRTISLVIVLASSLAMRKAFLQMIWAVEVVLGITS
jgi:hypothetical protein